MNWKLGLTVCTILTLLPLPMILLGVVYAELAMWLLDSMQ